MTRAVPMACAGGAMARAHGVMVFVLDWTEDSAARTATRTAAMDVVRAIVRARAGGVWVSFMCVAGAVVEVR